MRSQKELDARMANKAMRALRLACAELPHLSGLAQAVRLTVDRRVETAGVFASGRLLVNPLFLDTLELPDAAFVMAHEMLHLALRTHDRGAGSDGQYVNCAHDLIMNDMLEVELHRLTPACGIRSFGARHMSLERLVSYFLSHPDKAPSDCWQSDRPSRSRQGRPRTTLARISHHI